MRMNEVRGRRRARAGFRELISRAGSRPRHLQRRVLSGALRAASPWLFGFADQVYLLHLQLGMFEIGAALLTRTTPSIQPSQMSATTTH